MYLPNTTKQPLHPLMGSTELYGLTLLNLAEKLRVKLEQQQPRNLAAVSLLASINNNTPLRAVFNTIKDNRKEVEQMIGVYLTYTIKSI